MPRDRLTQAVVGWAESFRVWEGDQLICDGYGPAMKKFQGLLSLSHIDGEIRQAVWDALRGLERAAQRRGSIVDEAYLGNCVRDALRNQSIEPIISNGIN